MKIKNPRLKDVKISCRITASQYEKMKQAATSFEISFSEYLRAVLRTEPLIPQTDKAVLGELRRLGGLLKHVHNESKGAYSQKTAEAILALRHCATKLEKGLFADQTGGQSVIVFEEKDSE